MFYLERDIKSANLLICNFFCLTVAITSYELMTEVANMEEYSMKFAHELYTYPRTFGKEMGRHFNKSQTTQKKLKFT